MCEERPKQKKSEAVYMKTEGELEKNDSFIY